jgi:hypothetical protein
MKLACAALGLALLAVPTPPPARAPRVTAPPAAPPRVEVAFVLDTTGSMGGLLEGAKRRIWSIARRIGEGRPRPQLRIALVGYRDVGDDYVTRVHDLSGDMDEVYEHLSAFEARGGGDGPEHVSAALHDAVHRVSWTADADVLRIVFLVGDAPPHVDYQDGFDYRRHVREARRRGIVVEAIQCGQDPQTALVWREVAQGGDGHYAQIDGAGGMPLRVTPVDAELARLNAELSTTVVATGSAREREDVERKMTARRAMAAPAAAEAAGYFGGGARVAEKDLVDQPEAVQREELAKKPDEKAAVLQGKTEAEALRYLQEQKERRGRLQARIGELQKERDRYLSAEGPRDAFDEQVVGQLKDAAARHGIAY